MSDVRFTIERDGHPTILLDTDGGGPYGLQSRSRGFGVGPLSQTWRESAGDGMHLAGERVGGRVMDLAMIFLGDGRLSTGELIRQFVNLTRRRRDKPDARLVASFATGEVFTLPVVYTSGLELDYTNALPDLFEAVVVLSSESAYWTSKTPVQWSIAASGASVGLLPELSKLQVSSSQVLGSFTLSNPGDVESPITWVINGPATEVHVSHAGRGFSLITELVEGDVVTVDTAQRTVVNGAGESLYRFLGAAPKFDPLPVGRSQWSVTVVGAGDDTRLAGFSQSRREVVY